MFDQDLFQGEYRIKSIRLPHWDYSWPGYYAVTICTKNREHFFGRVKNGKMQYSEIGRMARKFWLQISKHYKNVGLDIFQIMPNHVHGVITMYETVGNVVETRDLASLRQRCFGPLQPQSLSTMIHSYKSAVTRWCKQNGHQNFQWQPGFYDHVIRNDQDLNRIRGYIWNNPLKWESDRNRIDPASDLALGLTRIKKGGKFT